jgi:hypothetical protein
MLQAVRALTMVKHTAVRTMIKLHIVLEKEHMSDMT